jgi:hypothetical protein
MILQAAVHLGHMPWALKKEEEEKEAASSVQSIRRGEGYCSIYVYSQLSTRSTKLTNLFIQPFLSTGF